MKNIREELMAYHQWLQKEFLISELDESDFTVDNYMEAINSASPESRDVIENEHTQVFCPHCNSSNLDERSSSIIKCNDCKRFWAK